jgi:hypothetical protein
MHWKGKQIKIAKKKIQGKNFVVKILIFIIARLNDEPRSGLWLTLFSSNTFLNSTLDSLIRIEKPDGEIEGEELFPK